MSLKNLKSTCELTLTADLEVLAAAGDRPNAWIIDVSIRGQDPASATAFLYLPKQEKGKVKKQAEELVQKVPEWPKGKKPDCYDINYSCSHLYLQAVE